MEEIFGYRDKHRREVPSLKQAGPNFDVVETEHRGLGIRPDAMIRERVLPDHWEELFARVGQSEFAQVTQQATGVRGLRRNTLCGFGESFGGQRRAQSMSAKVSGLSAANPRLPAADQRQG